MGATARRRAIEIDGLRHEAPIPVASRVGNLVVSSGLGGTDRATGEMPADLESQVTNMFANAIAVVAAAGGTVDDIVKFTIFVRVRWSRSTINTTWLELFPETEHRPARHTLTYELPDPMLVQCEIIAVVGA